MFMSLQPDGRAEHGPAIELANLPRASGGAVQALARRSWEEHSKIRIRFKVFLINHGVHKALYGLYPAIVLYTSNSFTQGWSDLTNGTTRRMLMGRLKIMFDGTLDVIYILPSSQTHHSNWNDRQCPSPVKLTVE